jgi:uncharacterized protein HemY
MMHLIIAVVLAAGIFVAGILVGRRNRKTVETVVSTVKTDVSKATGGKVNL